MADVPEEVFRAEREADWEALAKLLDAGLGKLAPRALSRALLLHRALSADLMRARSAGYSAELTGRLDDLAARAHAAIYAAPPRPAGAVRRFFRADFPRALRRRARLFALAAALFVLPGAVGFVGAVKSRQFAARILPAPMLEGMERAYAKGFDAGREAGTDVGMAGFYVWNNVGIAFRCFATGILLGLGSVFFLVYNGLVIGAVFGLVFGAGHGRNILTFTCGHAPLELTAIVISGAAGLALGLALVDTGGRTRLGSLRHQAREIALLVLGAAVMLLGAAAVEGFWSPSSVPAPVKWGAAAALTVGVAAYLGLAGRGARA